MAGIELTIHDLRTLIDLLRRVGRADDVELAGRLEHAIESETRMIGLSADDREVVLSVLDDPPDRLAELRGRLQRLHDRSDGN